MKIALDYTVLKGPTEPFSPKERDTWTASNCLKASTATPLLTLHEVKDYVCDSLLSYDLLLTYSQYQGMKKQPSVYAQVDSNIAVG